MNNEIQTQALAILSRCLKQVTDAVPEFDADTHLIVVDNDWCVSANQASHELLDWLLAYEGAEDALRYLKEDWSDGDEHRTLLSVVRLADYDKAWWENVGPCGSEAKCMVADME